MKKRDNVIEKLIDTFYDFSKELIEAFDGKKKEVEK